MRNVSHTYPIFSRASKHRSRFDCLGLQTVSSGPQGICHIMTNMRNLKSYFATVNYDSIVDNDLTNETIMIHDSMYGLYASMTHYDYMNIDYVTMTRTMTMTLTVILTMIMKSSRRVDSSSTLSMFSTFSSIAKEGRHVSITPRTPWKVDTLATWADGS